MTKVGPLNNVIRKSATDNKRNNDSVNDYVFILHF